MKFVPCKERLPNEDKLCIIEDRTGRRREMYFKIEDRRWYWCPNPYSVCGDGFIEKWLDESEPSFTLEDMTKCWKRCNMDHAANSGCGLPIDTFANYMKEKYNIDL